MLNLPRRQARRSSGCVALSICLVVSASCSASHDTPPTLKPTGALKLTTRRVASGLGPVVASTTRPGDATGLFVAEQGGRVVRLDTAAGAAPAPSATAGEVVAYSAAVSQAGGEQGLLGLAFSADGSVLYLSYSAQGSGDTAIDALKMNGRQAVAASAVSVLTTRQPFANHNGGGVVRGPDDMLWIGLGDGGSAGDPQGNGQNTATLLGSMLRVAPKAKSATAFAAGYDIPDGNPFAASSGKRPEIWAYGLRNPWKFSFDSETGDLWIADVGQEKWEEVDALRASAKLTPGANFGWNRFEGRHTYPGDAVPTKTAGVIGPVAEYAHGDGRCSISGGAVYRGTAIERLQGLYIFGDYCGPGLLAVPSNPAANEGDMTKPTRPTVNIGTKVTGLSSVSTGPDGELYLLSTAGTVDKVVAA